MLTQRLDLRGGRNCWSPESGLLNSDHLPERTDVAVIGAGVMGAMVAERLAVAGKSVAVLDRRAPTTGATGGSTALVMWGADVPLTHLAKRVGEAGAAGRWRRVYRAVEDLNACIEQLGISCGWRARPEIYLAGNVLDEQALVAEANARTAAGLPSIFIAGNEIGERFGLAARPGLLSEGSYEVDPVALTVGFLKAAQHHGAALCFPHDVERIEQCADGVRVWLAGGWSLIAKRVVIATGYEAARLFLPEHFCLSSSYAIATPPGVAPLWAENALIWEAADPYLYARATTDGRVIFGGEDEDLVDADKRDALIPEKRAALEAKAAKLLGRDDLKFDCAWAATFGSSPDGLPAIGRARNMDHVYLAAGFGGNGVTFARLGADLIAMLVHGGTSDAASWFDPYRDFQN